MNAIFRLPRPRTARLVWRLGLICALTLCCAALPAQERATLRAHQDEVDAIAFSPDGKHFATSGWDRTVRVWDASNGKERYLFRFLRPTALAFARDGKQLLAAHPDGGSGENPGVRVKGWDMATGEENHSVLCGETGRILGFAPNGYLLALRQQSQRDGRATFLVKLAPPTPQKGYKLAGEQAQPVAAVAFSKDGRFVAFGDFGSFVKVCERDSGKEVLSFKAGWGHVWSLAFSPDGKLLASGTYERTVRLWDAATGKLWAEIEAPSRRSGDFPMQFSADGKLLAVRDGNDLRLWDVTKRTTRALLKGHTRPIQALALSPDGKMAVTGSRDNTVKIRDIPKAP